MISFMDRPIYDITLDEWNTGVFATSLVEKPATESNFVFMSEQEFKDSMQFKVGDEDKREVVGAVLIPDKLIPRKSPQGEEFYVRFSKDIIKELNQKMHKEGFNRFFTVQHELDARDTVKFLESWIKETDEDKSSALGIDAPIGSLFMKVKIDSDLLWKNIKDGNLKGFSVELDASLIKSDFNKQEPMKIDFEKLLKNELVVSDELTLRFNELAEGESVVQMGEAPEMFTGEFSNETHKYTVEEGVIKTVVELEHKPDDDGDKPTDLQPAVDALNSKLDALTEKIDGLFTAVNEHENLDSLQTKFEAVEQKIEEFKLEMRQVEADSKVKKNSENEDPDKMEFSVEDYRTASNWNRK